jgi:hypothetical protein
LLRILEFSAAREREIVHARPRESDAEVDGILHRVPTRDTFVAQVPAAHDERGADTIPDSAVDLEGQPRALLAWTTIAVSAIVQSREERRHCVRMRIVQFHAVETGLLGPPGGVGEDAGQHLGKLPDVRLVHVGDAFAVPKTQRLDLSW